MIAELGHFALIIALAMALLLSLVPMIGSFRGYSSWMRLASSLSLGQLLFVAVSFVCLAIAFLMDDFSLKYVSQNSNTALPDHYKISAVWAAHEGSLMLWALILAAFNAATNIVFIYSGPKFLIIFFVILVIFGIVGFNNCNLS